MTYKKVFLVLGFVIVDIGIYIFLGLLLMSYDDFYNESKGAYWSLASMTTFEKSVYISLIIWNIINWILGGLIVFKFLKFLLNKFVN